MPTNRLSKERSQNPIDLEALKEFLKGGKEGYKLYQKGDDEESRGLGLGFFVAVFVVLINNTFGDRWTYLEIMAYLWVFAGMVARLNIIELVPQPAVRQPVVQRAAQKVKKKKIRYYDL